MEVIKMAEMLLGDYGSANSAAEIKLPKSSTKDAKNKHKVEARRRIDDLLEQKRLRQMLDLDEEDELELDFTE
jgi:hypothetical protein